MYLFIIIIIIIIIIIYLSIIIIIIFFFFFFFGGGATFLILLPRISILNKLLHCSLWEYSGLYFDFLGLFFILGVKSTEPVCIFPPYFDFIVASYMYVLHPEIKL